MVDIHTNNRIFASLGVLDGFRNKVEFLIGGEIEKERYLSQRTNPRVSSAK
jgi:hypothetical protein